jgi:hypothetical protein
MKNMRLQGIHVSDIAEQHCKAAAIEKGFKENKFAVECTFLLSGDALRRVLPK